MTEILAGPSDPFENDLRYWAATTLSSKQAADLRNASEILAGTTVSGPGASPHWDTKYGYNAHAAELLASRMAADDVAAEAHNPGQPLIALARAVGSGVVYTMTEQLGPVYGPHLNHIVTPPHGQPE